MALQPCRSRIALVKVSLDASIDFIIDNCTLLYQTIKRLFKESRKTLKRLWDCIFAHYNFVRIHKTLKCTPAMEAGVVNELWTVRDLVERAN